MADKNKKEEEIKNDTENSVEPSVKSQDQINLETRLKELEDKLNSTVTKLSEVTDENEALKNKPVVSLGTPVTGVGNKVLICNSKVRTFTVDPNKVIKIYKGTREGIILRDRVLTITPGSIIEVTPELADFLLSYPKDFSRYDVPLA